MFIQSKDLGLLLCLLVFVNTDLVQASFKRGLSNASGFYKCNDLDQFGSNIAWWYDWQIKSGYHANKYGCTNTLRSNHIPMSNKWDKSNSNWLFRNTESSDYVLGFNEPNHHSQANMSPQQAATNWRELEEAGKTVFGAQYFVSPSATPGPADKATDYIKWFDYFFGNCTDCQIDYLATHYFSWNCDANEVMTFLSGLWQRYNKKIWLTEFACPRATVDASDQLSFMTAILPQLEAADHVYRYAWYTTRITATDRYIKPSASLLEADESTLTPLGEHYNSYVYTPA